MSNFATFEKQYASSSSDAISHLNQYDLTSESHYLHKVQKSFDEIQDVLEQMEFDADSKQRRTIANYKREYQGLEQRWKRAREQQDRSDLLNSARTNASTSFTSGGNLNTSDRERLLDTERLERGTRKLEDGYRIALDTEQHGREILEELQREREVLERSKNRLHHANTMLGSSSDIVTQMYRHVIQDRLTLYVIGGILGLIVFIAIMSKFL